MVSEDLPEPACTLEPAAPAEGGIPPRSRRSAVERKAHGTEVTAATPELHAQIVALLRR